uniref:Uncharacterized protein n=1 Tax=viral metagenome TaxID=1070528 RepID=A0A6C0KY10_9ZZZZ
MPGKTQKRKVRRSRTQRRGARGGDGFLSGIGRLNPMTISTALAKLDALLITNKVPFVFSDGTMASQYVINEQNPANRENGGRGNIPYAGTKGKASGFFSNLGWSRTQNSAAGNRYLDSQPPMQPQGQSYM